MDNQEYEDRGREVVNQIYEEGGYDVANQTMEADCKGTSTMQEAMMLPSIKGHKDVAKYPRLRKAEV